MSIFVKFFIAEIWETNGVAKRIGIRWPAEIYEVNFSGNSEGSPSFAAPFVKIGAPEKFYKDANHFLYCTHCSFGALTSKSSLRYFSACSFGRWFGESSNELCLMVLYSCVASS